MKRILYVAARACRTVARPVMLATIPLAALLATTTIDVQAAAAGQAGLAARGLAPNNVGGPGSLLPLMLRSVELSDEQDAEVGKIVASHRPRIGRLFIRLAAAQRDLADHLYGADPVTDESVEEKIAQVQHRRTQLLREGVAAVVEARQLLDDAQIARMAATNRRYRALRAEMRGLFAPAPDAAVAAE